MAQLAAWLILSASLVSCGHGGPKVDVCIVDVQSKGYQCADANQKGYFVRFDDSHDLGCASPGETESFLKACKEKKVLPVTLCSYSIKEAYFRCIEPNGNQYPLALLDSDNYVCLSSLHRKRVIERCLSGG